MQLEMKTPSLKAALCELPTFTHCYAAAPKQTELGLSCPKCLTLPEVHAEAHGTGSSRREEEAIVTQTRVVGHLKLGVVPLIKAGLALQAPSILSRFCSRADLRLYLSKSVLLSTR